MSVPTTWQRGKGARPAVLQQFLTGDQQAGTRRPLQQRVRKPAGRIQEVLAVVQDQEHSTIAQRVNHFILCAPVSRKVTPNA